MAPSVLASRAAVLPTVALLSGCDPVLNIYGSFFPAWVVSLCAGVVLTVLLRLVFAASRLETEMGPLVVVYPALAFLLTCAIWLAIFRS